MWQRLDVEHRAGRSYVIEQYAVTGTPAYWVRYRQDENGLYEFDYTGPPECAAVVRAGRTSAEGTPADPAEVAWASASAALTDPGTRAAYRVAWESIQARAASVRRVDSVTDIAILKLERLPSRPSLVAVEFVAGEVSALGTICLSGFGIRKDHDELLTSGERGQQRSSVVAQRGIRLLKQEGGTDQ